MEETPPPASGDEALVARARRGDSAAFDTLVRLHHGAVFRLARVLVGDPDLAADVTQETFLKAHLSLPGYRGDGSFRSWLLAVARNEARGALRRQGRRREEGLDGVEAAADSKGGGDPEDPLLSRVDGSRLLLLLQRLPEKQRLSISLRVFEGLSFREVGEVTGSSEGGARVNYFLGIRRLRELVDGGRRE